MRAIIRFILAAPIFTVYYGQIQVDNSQTAEFYIKNVLLGQGIEVGRIRHIGMIGGLGQFESDPKIIGVRSGLLLSTGNVDSIRGPNRSSSYTSWGELPESKLLVKELIKGDKDLNRLCRGKTTDITSIEFDFVPVKNRLEFNYVFASDEYMEYVGSSYNDVFGFFLSGPGIRKKINLAVLPDKRTPISINSVNHRINQKYFRQNNRRISVFKRLFMSKAKVAEITNLKRELQFDGLTTVLKVYYDVKPYQKYHIKIAIGDVSDRIFDSAVFLEAGSFVSVTDSAGKYYEELEAFSNTVPDIDSILGIQDPPDAIPESQINEDFEITDIYFDKNSHSLADSARTQLDDLAKYLLTKKTFKCVLYGYTDNVGSKSYNQKLSEERAKSVIDYLASKGIDRRNLDYIGRNFENPKFENASDNGRARNRRVEIVIEE